MQEASHSSFKVRASRHAAWVKVRVLNLDREEAWRTGCFVRRLVCDQRSVGSNISYTRVYIRLFDVLNPCQQIQRYSHINAVRAVSAAKARRQVYNTNGLISVLDGYITGIGDIDLDSHHNDQIRVYAQGRSASR